MSAIFLNVVAFFSPLVGVALGAWSFHWAETGATPDNPFGASGVDVSGEKIPLLAGERWRARRWARMLFNTGALLLAAAVPLGNAVSHVSDLVNWMALCGYLIIAGAFVYAAKELYGIWQNLREDAFSIYFNKDMYFLYDQKKVRKMYYDLNPMPIWSLCDANWYENRKLPDIREVVRLASKAQ